MIRRIFRGAALATRRSILQTGAAAAVILGAGAAAWSLTRAPKLAREPWAKAGTGFGDARLDALARLNAKGYDTAKLYFTRQPPAE